MLNYNKYRVNFLGALSVNVYSMFCGDILEFQRFYILYKFALSICHHFTNEGSIPKQNANEKPSVWIFKECSWISFNQHACF